MATSEDVNLLTRELYAGGMGGSTKPPRSKGKGLDKSTSGARPGMNTGKPKTWSVETLIMLPEGVDSLNFRKGSKDLNTLRSEGRVVAVRRKDQYFATAMPVGQQLVQFIIECFPHIRSLAHPEGGFYFMFPEASKNTFKTSVYHEQNPPSDPESCAALRRIVKDQGDFLVLGECKSDEELYPEKRRPPPAAKAGGRTHDLDDEDYDEDDRRVKRKKTR